jgi:hypothetical protein
MGGFVGDVLGSVGDAAGDLVGGVGDIAGNALQGVASNPLGAGLALATGNYAPLIGSALGGAMGGGTAARPTPATGGYNYGNSFMPSQGGGYGTGGSMMGPQPIVINNTPGQTQQDQSQGLFSQLLPFLMQAGGGLAQGQVNKEAAQTQADALRQAGQQAAQGAQFRPVGTTTTFGTSNFQVDPNTGQLLSAGYNLSPQMQAYQDQIMGSNRQSLTDAANLQNLGRGYIAQSPEAAAQDWYSKQQALLNPSRDVESARLANQLQQTGRTGVAVAQGGNLGMANPEQQALANARSMQDLQLASQAQQQGRAQTQFGQGLLTSAYDPFNAGMKTSQNIESLGQQPFAQSTALAQQQAAAGANAGRLGYTGAQDAANAMLRANQVSPFADILSALGKTPAATSAIGSAAGGLLGGLFGGNASAGQGGGGGNYNMGSNGYGDFGSFNSDALNFGGYSGGGTNVYDPNAFNLNTDYSTAANNFDFSNWF